MKLTLIRSATLKLEYGGICFLIDPAFADKLTGPSFAGKSKNPLVDLPMRKEEIIAGRCGHRLAYSFGPLRQSGAGNHR